MIRQLAISVAFIVALPVTAHAAIYKCQEAGKTVYSDKPCTSGASGSSGRIDTSPAISIGKRTTGGGLSDGEREILGEIEAKESAKKSERARQAQTSAWILEKKVGSGMTPDEVRQSWGKPSRINTHVGAGGRSEQWVFDRGGVRQYVHIDNGAVTSVSTQE